MTVQHPAAPWRRRAAIPLLVLTVSASLLVSGCGGDGGGSAGTAAGSGKQAVARTAGGEAAAAGASKDDPTVHKGTSAQDTDLSHAAGQSYIVRTAQLEVQAKDVPAAARQADQLTTGAGGYVSSEVTEADSARRDRTKLVLRVPPEAYQGLLADLGELGKVVERSRTAEDVTDQVVDVESRVKSQKASVERIRKLMDEATTLSDVVTLESELSTREADLESLEQQQKSLAARTSMATITLTLVEPAAAAAKDDDDDGMVDAFVGALGGGWHAFYVAGRALLVAVGAVLPFAVLAGLVYWPLRGRLRRRLGEPVPPLLPTALAAATPATGAPAAPTAAESESPEQQS